MDEATTDQSTAREVAEAAARIREAVPELEYLRVAAGQAGQVRLDMIRVRAGVRGHGHGQRALGLLIAWADRHGHVLTATPDPTPLPGEGRMNKARLRRWYARHGFVGNTGRRARHEYSEAMYRLPRAAGTEHDEG